MPAPGMPESPPGSPPGSPDGEGPPEPDDPAVVAEAAGLPPPPAHEHAKLFVGLSRWPASDADVQQLMMKYGELEECYVMKAKGGKSKGCAFVKYVDRKNGNLGQCLRVCARADSVPCCSYRAL
jgi:hypothetical protein